MGGLGTERYMYPSGEQMDGKPWEELALGAACAIFINGLRRLSRCVHSCPQSTVDQRGPASPWQLSTPASGGAKCSVAGPAGRRAVGGHCASGPLALALPPARGQGHTGPLGATPCSARSSTRPLESAFPDLGT